MEEKEAKKKESKLEKLKDPNLDELKTKLAKIKTKLDDFQKSLLKKFDKYVVGITLLPPRKDEKNKDALDILVIVDDSDSKKMPKLELRDRLEAISNNIAKNIDKNMYVEVVLLSEMKQNCFDNKFEFMQDIAISAPIYDPKDLIAALKVSEVHKNMVMKKFEKYVTSYVAAGSLFRGEKSHDIDVYVIVDDTDVKKMSRFELKEKLRAIILSQAFEASAITHVKKKFHVQVYILTDFWEGLKDANPVFFTLLRDGIPLYDRGVFMPWKLLLEMGRIKPSPEAIDMFVASGDKMENKVRFRLREIIEADIYWSVLTPTQAALMMYGVAPPTPKETVKIMNDVFVKKEKLLEKKYVDMLDEIRQYYKDLEHDKITQVTGKDVDRVTHNAAVYLKRLKKLFQQIEQRKEQETLKELYTTLETLAKDMLAINDINVANLELGLKKLQSKNEITSKTLKEYKEIMKTKKEKLNKVEYYKVRRESKLLTTKLLDYIQRKKGSELQKAALRVKYEDKFGEVIVLDEKVYIIKDLSNSSEISKANLSNSGEITSVEKSSIKEFEDNLTKKRTPKSVFIKQKTIESLKEIFGPDVEVLVNY